MSRKVETSDAENKEEAVRIRRDRQLQCFLWRREQYISPKHLYLSTMKLGVTSSTR